LQVRMGSKPEAEDLDRIYPNAGDDHDEFENSMRHGNVALTSATTPSAEADTPASRGTYSRIIAAELTSRDLGMDASISRPRDYIFNRQSSYVNTHSKRPTLAVDNRESTQTVGTLDYYVRVLHTVSLTHIFDQSRCGNSFPTGASCTNWRASIPLELTRCM
jgi:hypothetical protein